MVNSNDFSLFALFTAGFATLANAYSVAVGPFPSGNPLTIPAQGDTVTAGVSTNIIWTPTVGSTVTLYLCEGPSSNCVNRPVPFADHVPNNGVFSWTPTLDLIPTNGQGYGIQLVVDGSGEYQWTSQFGVANPSYRLPSEVPSVIVPSEVPSVIVPSATPSESAPVVLPTSTTEVVHYTATVTPVLPTATGGAPTTIVLPTVAPTVPTSLLTATSAIYTPTSTPLPPSNGAGQVGAGFGLVLAAALAHLLL